jgi:hypothetical protein
MIFNEDGQAYALPENHKATEELKKSLNGHRDVVSVHLWAPAVTIVGDALVSRPRLDE